MLVAFWHHLQQYLETHLAWASQDLGKGLVYRIQAFAEKRSHTLLIKFKYLGVSVRVRSDPMLPRIVQDSCNRCMQHIDRRCQRLPFLEFIRICYTASLHQESYPVKQDPEASDSSAVFKKLRQLLPLLFESVFQIFELLEAKRTK